jgi:hypothetical protein
MAAARYDLTVEPGVPFAISFQWTTAAGVPISLSGRNLYMKFSRAGIVHFDSGSVGGITLVKEPSSTTGRIDVAVDGTHTQQLLRPYEDLGTLHYVLDLLDPGNAGNTIRLINGLVLMAEEFE